MLTPITNITFLSLKTIAKTMLESALTNFLLFYFFRFSYTE